MNQSRGALVFLGHSETPDHRQALPRGDGQVQAAGMVGSASEAVREMAGQHGSRRRCLIVPVQIVAHPSTLLARLGVFLAHAPQSVMRPSSMACVEGQDGANRSYRERLLAPWWIWLLAAIFTLSVAVAYDFALGFAAGALAACLVGGGATALLLVTSSTLSVDDCVVRVGRARLPVGFVGDVEVLDAQASALARTRDFNPSAHLVLRTWASSRSVCIGVTDNRDPHPYWLVSTRHPERFAAAIRTAAHSAVSSGQVLPEQAG